MTATHPWTRYVAIGDSFTEGVGDVDESLPNGVRGWADRVAEQLALGSPDFAYANLAVRGKLIDQIIAEQVDAAIALQPDLVTISAGGNDLLRPGSDADSVAARLEWIIERLVETGATVLMFTGVDTKFSTAAFRLIRPTVAIYNCNVRAIADRLECPLVDQWAFKEIQHTSMWAADRLHLNEFGHHEVARRVLETLGVETTLEPMKPEPVPPRRWTEARIDNIRWARQHAVPWVGRRLRGVSSGDLLSPKYPEPRPIAAPGAAGTASAAHVADRHDDIGDEPAGNA